ncbi:hypothetical protein T02_6 [Trichinella nativa]|uniref:Uncharacterized protein n=1 Tax=Trichinella nativa TaxID=6335 RepID=A0A0V1KI56_9BILA|nr:hypothetical protein T02_6 [Trichinella nativa]
MSLINMMHRPLSEIIHVSLKRTKASYFPRSPSGTFVRSTG